MYLNIFFNVLIIVVVFILVFFAFAFAPGDASVKKEDRFFHLPFSKIHIEENINSDNLTNGQNGALDTQIAKHIQKPENVKGIYMSAWVAGTKSFRDRLTKLADDTEINSVVIDFKDSTGVVSVPANTGASVNRKNSESKRAIDLAQYIEILHSKNIYVIARIAVFQDPVYSKNNPNSAVQFSNGNIWKDRHGLSWVDPMDKNFHEYIKNLAIEAYNLGFDEINFDYIRYPTDGSPDKVYPLTGDTSIQLSITTFLKDIHSFLKEKNIPMSIDVFGQIVSTPDHMGIGQYYEDLLGATDAICPMVYPSHFYPGYKNLKSPNNMPYETIKLSLSDAIKRRLALNSNTEIRPWLQDFSLDGVTYDYTKVRAQINAAKDLGINSWLLWDPRNEYTKAALKSE